MSAVYRTLYEKYEQNDVLHVGIQEVVEAEKEIDTFLKSLDRNQRDRFLVPFFKGNLPGIWGTLLSAWVIVLFISPFLRAIMIKKNHSVEFVTLWRDSRGNRAPLVATIVLRILLAVSFVMFVIAGLFKLSVGLVFGVAVLLVIVVFILK